MRIDGRRRDQLREIKITPNYTLYAEGSVLVETGNTKVICTASIEPGVPKWLHGTGKGWVTAEYGMLPRSTAGRIRRDKVATGGRTQEIARLIGRSLRSIVNLQALGERQITVDCDVIQADGGTRTASITGGFVALCLAMKWLKENERLSSFPITDYVAGISVGIQDGHPLLDLCYEEDSAADTDMNFVMTSEGKFVEIQGTAEHKTFDETELQGMLVLARSGCKRLFAAQHEILKDILPLKH